MTADEVRALVGEDVVLELAPASGETRASGRIVGKIEAADGLVVVLEPRGQPGARRTYHYQHIVRASAV